MHRDDVIIPSPCSADWSEMRGDARRRLCELCDQHVHDLSAMTERRARAVMAEPEVCVRYLHAPSGEIVHRPPSRLRRWAMAAALVTALPAAASPALADEPEPGWIAWGVEHALDALESVQDRVFGEPVLPEPVSAEPDLIDSGAPPVRRLKGKPKPRASQGELRREPADPGGPESTD